MWCLGVVLLPGTAFVELVLHAGGEVGCPVVRELVLRGSVGVGRGWGCRFRSLWGSPGEWVSGRWMCIRVRVV